MTGRTAVVTGGSSGIGAATAARLACAGARVVSLDLQPPAADIGFIELDVTDQAACASALAEVGAVDILVNSAGINGVNAPAWDLPEGEFELVTRVNLFGTYYMCRAALPAMMSRGRGRIVNVASIAGKEGNPEAAAYSASKGAVIALTKTLGKEAAQTGVLVNCVAPAVTNTPLTEHQASASDFAYAVSRIPLGRPAEADEVAAMIVWLCSDDCSFSTGAVFDVTGGRATY